MGSRTSAEVTQRAREKLHNFFRLIDEDDTSAATQSVKTLAGALGLNDGDMGRMRNRNLVNSITSWRKIFGAFPWVSRDKVKVADHLVEREVLCKFCYQANSRTGVLDAIASTLRAHEKTKTHMKLAGGKNVPSQSAAQSGAKRKRDSEGRQVR